MKKLISIFVAVAMLASLTVIACFCWYRADSKMDAASR